MSALFHWGYLLLNTRNRNNNLDLVLKIIILVNWKNKNCHLSYLTVSTDEGIGIHSPIDNLLNSLSGISTRMGKLLARLAGLLKIIPQISQSKSRIENFIIYFIFHENSNDLKQ